MFNLSNLLEHKPAGLSKDDIASLLKTSPEVIDAFEKAYQDNVLNIETPDDFFHVNSRQMAEEMHKNDNDVDTSALVNKIVDEFLTETKVYKYTRPDNNHKHHTESKVFLPLPDDYTPVSREDINSLPPASRPQCTYKLQKRDIGQPSYPMLLMQLNDSMNPKYDERRRKTAYHMFRQGLDILDIDPIMYDIIGMNPISIGHWLPNIVDAVDRESFFKIPSTTIIKVPMNILQLTRCEYQGLTRTTLNIVDKFCYKAFELDENKDYFIKTGTYSSKFDFRNCRVHDPKEIRELGEYLLFIHTQACQMASPLNVDTNGKPKSIYGVSTTNEWCVREYIKDVENNPCIYKGLPLHTEYRVFVDFDSDEILSCNAYWDPNTMKKRFAEGADRSLHDLHDYAIYKSYEDTLMNRYYENKDKVINHLESIVPHIPLSGQWSIDIMQNGHDFWIIDMALAETSAFYNSVSIEKRKPSPENWLPDLSQK